MTLRPSLQIALRCLVSFLGLSLVGACQWSEGMFGDVTFEQLVFHVRFGVNGLVEIDAPSVRRFVILAVLIPLAIAVLLTLLAWFAARRPRAGITFRLVARRLPVALVVGGIGYVLLTFDYITYARAYFGPDVFASAYVDPAATPITADAKPKSLVLIYVESLENSYQDPSRFGRDLLAPLTKLQRRFASFDSYEQMPGTNWTMAGIVATQCGIPLKVMLLPPPDKAGLHLKGFLPSAICLGDILHARGYENIFMTGPDLDFAGTGAFLRDHGYSRSFGQTQWIAAGEDKARMIPWGLRDDRLFAHARTELAKLVASGQPFNLTVLTVDTHGPDGILSDECRRRAVRAFAGIVECSGSQVAAFVTFIEAQGWLDRVSIVVQGDHLAMENPVIEKLGANPRRRVFNLIVSSPVETPLRQHMNHFDMFPTILDVLGMRTESGRLGIGYCMLESCGSAAPPEARFAQFEAGLLNRSSTYAALWSR